MRQEYIWIPSDHLTVRVENYRYAWITLSRFWYKSPQFRNKVTAHSVGVTLTNIKKVPLNSGLWTAQNTITLLYTTVEASHWRQCSPLISCTLHITSIKATIKPNVSQSSLYGKCSGETSIDLGKSEKAALQMVSGTVQRIPRWLFTPHL